MRSIARCPPNGAGYFAPMNPVIDLDLTREELDPNISFTRPSGKTYFDKNGVMRMATNNEWPVEYDPLTGECLGRSVWVGTTNVVPNSRSSLPGTQAGNINEISTAIPAFYPGDDVIRVKKNDPANTNVAIQGFTISAAGTYCLSLAVYVPDTITQTVRFRFDATYANSNIVSMDFNMLPKNKWVRVSNLVTFPSIPIATNFVLTILDNNPDFIYISSPQMELTTIPTPYVPTKGSVATRANETVSIDASSMSATGGKSLFAEFNLSPINSNNNVFIMDFFKKSGSEGSFYIYYNKGASVCDVKKNGNFIGSVIGSTSFTPNVDTKLLMTLSENSAINSVNGSIIGSVMLSDTAPEGLDTVYLGRGSGGLDSFANGFFKKVKIWGRAISQPEMIGATS